MKGQCLCGAIEVTAPDKSTYSACHCTTCIKWNGGPYFATYCGSDVTFTGTSEPTRFASSEWAERGFCPSCGTHLFYFLAPKSAYILSVGLFPDVEFEMDRQVFIEEKPTHYALANDTPKLTKADIFGG